MGSKGTLLRGAPGDAGCPCPTADSAALEYLRAFDGAIRWCLNVYAVPGHDRNAVHQDVRVRVLLRFRRLGPIAPGGTSTYITTIARRCCQTYWQQRSQRVVDPGDTLSSTAMPADEWLDRQDAHERLHLAVATLPPMSREVMRLVLTGRSLVEIAEHLGIGHGATKVIAHRARVLLRKRLVR